MKAGVRGKLCSVAEEAGSARKGKAVEHLIAASVVLASKGVLNALTALVDDEGVDVTFKRRHGFRTLDVQIKSAFLEGRRVLREEHTLRADVRHATFRPRPDLYVLFVVVDGLRADIGPLWLVPSEVLAAQGFDVETGGQTFRRFQTSTKADSKGMWREYRIEREELARAILAVLEGLDAE